jgi:hypothetical protein
MWFRSRAGFGMVNKLSACIAIELLLVGISCCLEFKRSDSMLWLVYSHSCFCFVPNGCFCVE